MIKIYIIILLLIIFFGIFNSNFSKEKFDNSCINDIQNDINEEDREFYVPDGNSNTQQTIDMTRKLMETLSQSHADSVYDHQVGSIDNIKPPSGTKR